MPVTQNTITINRQFSISPQIAYQINKLLDSDKTAKGIQQEFDEILQPVKVHSLSQVSKVSFVDGSEMILDENTGRWSPDIVFSEDKSVAKIKQ